MTTPTPDKSVDEIVEEFDLKIAQAHPFTLTKQYKDADFQIMKDWLTKTLKAERQKREEVVEKYEEATDWIDGVVRQVAFDSETGKMWQHWLDDGKRILKTITQPNNPKI